MGGSRYLTRQEREAWAAWLPGPPCIRTVYTTLVARATIRHVPVETFLAFVKNEYGPFPGVRSKNFLTSTKVWERFDRYLRNLEAAAPTTLVEDIVNFQHECGLYETPEAAVQAPTANLSAIFRCAIAVRLELPGFAEDCREAARRQLVVNPYLATAFEEEFGKEVVRWIRGM